MKKATTLDEVYDSFDYGEPLSENEYDDFYVDVYKDKIKIFMGNIKRNQSYKKMFLIAGQRGNGKSTILNMLKKQNKDFDKYDIKHISAKEVFGYSDLDIVDMLITIALYLIDNSSNKSKLRKNLRKDLEELASINSGDIEKQDIKTSKKEINKSIEGKISTPSMFSKILSSILPLDITISGVISYKANDTTRNEIKKIYKINKDKLVNIVNSVIASCKNENEILLIIDGLEKTIIENKESIKNILTKDINLLKDLQCFKIITIPIYLKEEINQLDTSILDFTMEIDEDTKDIRNINLFNKIIEKRISSDKINDLITKEARELAIKISVGNIRLLLNIIQASVIEALDVLEVDKIDKDIIKTVSKRIGGGMSTTAQQNKTFLNKIDAYGYTEDNEKDKTSLENMIQAGLVFAYCNGKTYYKINPTIKESIK